MNEFMEWVRQNLWAGWGVLALGLAAAELLTLDLTLLMLAGGALAGGVTALGRVSLCVKPEGDRA